MVAPIAGVTDYTYRKILSEFNPDMMFSEMASSDAITRNNEKTSEEILKGIDGCGVQIFGRDIELMVQSAKYLEKLGVKHIDINMGCPVPKVIKNGYGAALLRDPEYAEKLLTAIRESIDIDMSIKIRIGFKEFKEPIKIAKIAEKLKLKFITIHGRTREQMYTGKSDWNIIKNIKEEINIPVIGNGDIFTAEDALEKALYSKVDGVMLARGIFGNPWLIREVKEIFEYGEVKNRVTNEDRIEMAIRHLKMDIEDKGETKGVLEMRKHICWYLKGMRNAARIKDTVNMTESYEEVKKILLDYKKILKAESVLQ